MTALRVPLCWLHCNMGKGNLQSPAIVQGQQQMEAGFQVVQIQLCDFRQPFIYTEGKYNSRLEQIVVPEGKCLIHFENVDMKRAKETVGKFSFISGNLSGSLLEFGTKEQIVDQTKYLIDTCSPGGGYVFDTDMCLENAKPENFDAMYETVMIYGSR